MVRYLGTAILPRILQWLGYSKGRWFFCIVFYSNFKYIIVNNGENLKPTDYFNQQDSNFPNKEKKDHKYTNTYIRQINNDFSKYCYSTFRDDQMHSTERLENSVTRLLNFTLRIDAEPEFAQ